MPRPISAFAPDSGNNTAMFWVANSGPMGDCCMAPPKPFMSPYICAGSVGVISPYSENQSAWGVQADANKDSETQKPKILFISIELSILFCIILL